MVDIFRVDGETWAKCVCSCNLRKLFVTRVSCLRNGNTTSCGCLRIEVIHKVCYIHGEAPNSKNKNKATSIYMAWLNMKRRCYDSKNQDYARYGGRGIKVCEKWRNSYLAFKNDVGDKPGPNYSLDRYPDKNGDYRPNNVRWATAKQQANNRNKVKRK